jgi:L-methionine (R)-S-oxide reductase
MNYPLLQKQIQSLLENETDVIANMANFSAFIFQEMDKINWAGFYFVKDNQLVLGPFQGKVACVRIPWGKGVCGTAAEKQNSIIVENVNSFPGHIACDGASKSELVIPLIINNKTFAVFDIDSPNRARFNEDDKQSMESLIKIFMDTTVF